jgi:hypothetical protein
MSNIAEGFGRGTQDDFIRFLGYALGSLKETRSHLWAAHDRGYMERDVNAAPFQEGTEIRMTIVSFIRQMVMPGSGVKNVKKIKPWAEEEWELYERYTGQQRPEFFRQHAPRPSCVRSTRYAVPRSSGQYRVLGFGFRVLRTEYCQLGDWVLRTAYSVLPPAAAHQLHPRSPPSYRRAGQCPDMTSL